MQISSKSKACAEAEWSSKGIDSEFSPDACVGHVNKWSWTKLFFANKYQ